MKETTKKNSNRLYFNYGSIDSFTNGLKKDDLVILGTDPIRKAVAVANNLIREVVKQDKQVLYVSLGKEKEELLKRYPELLNPNILIDDKSASIIDVEKKAAAHQGFDLIVIDNSNKTWNDTYLVKTKTYHRYKKMAEKVRIPVLILTGVSSIIGTRSRPRQIKVVEYCNYMFFLYRPVLQPYQEDYNHRTDDLFNEMEIRMFNFKTRTENKAYAIYSKETYEIREISSRIRKLLRLARSLGLSTEDSIRYAFYWEDKELPEETGKTNKGEQDDDQCWT